MRAEILTPDELTHQDIDAFWEQDVNMDDWDYIVLAPPETITATQRRDEWNGTECTEWDQQVYEFDRILVGSSSNRWYKAAFRGKEYAVGVAYHA
jgi:hypothetical protein